MIGVCACAGQYVPPLFSMLVMIVNTYTSHYQIGWCVLLECSYTLRASRLREAKVRIHA